MIGTVLHASQHSGHDMPLSHDAALTAIAVGAVVFGLIAYDIYRVYWE